MRRDGFPAKLVLINFLVFNDKIPILVKVMGLRETIQISP
jgi:hypothetical protein